MKTLNYTLDKDFTVRFRCPKCGYHNHNAAYLDELVYRDEIDGICAACKEEYILIPKIVKRED